jgi:hypothetical protein
MTVGADEVEALAGFGETGWAYQRTTGLPAGAWPRLSGFIS